MKICYLKRIVCAVVFIAFSFSCSSDLDFNQANDLKIEPVIVGNLSYFDIPATDFVAAGGAEKNLVFNVQEFDVFRDKYFNSYLQKVSLYFEINNTITREYAFDIRFLDENSDVAYTIHFDIPTYSGTENILRKTVVFEGANLELLKRGRKMQFILNMKAGPALNSSSTGSLKLRSEATVYLAIE